MCCLPEFFSQKSLHELDVSLTIIDVDGLQSSSVIHSVNLSNHLWCHGEEITSIETQPVVFCLQVTSCNLLRIIRITYIILPSSDLWQTHFLILQVVLPEELLHHEGDSLHPGDSVALVVEVDQVPGLATQRQEEPHTLGSSSQRVHVLKI